MESEEFATRDLSEIEPLYVFLDRLAERPGARVVRVLDRLQASVGLPGMIVMDNGPEFSGRALDMWAYAHGVRLRFVRPDKPIENAFVESFNGKFRDECLNEHWFASLAEAQTLIEQLACSPASKCGKDLAAAVV